MPTRIVWPIVASLLLAAACDDRPALPPEPPEVPEPTVPFGDRFDPASTGTVAGVVRWRGDLPRVGPFHAIDEPLSDHRPMPGRDRPNPNAPRIDPGSRAVAGAVVFLRGVDPRRARPWDHSPARVELREQRFWFLQGGAASNVGFARAGDSVEFVSRDDRLHVAQARGPAFFSIALPGPDRPRSRRFETPGVVELLSGCGYFWMRGYLHVSDHPYLVRADARGRFRLDQVPAGEYDLVAWHPDWRVVKTRRNPDLFRVQQVQFGPALETVSRVRVRPRERIEADLSLGHRP